MFIFTYYLQCIAISEGFLIFCVSTVNIILYADCVLLGNKKHT